MIKHPLHIAFEGWKLTQEGRGCHDTATLHLPPTDVYLANRLYRAFYAGAQAQHDICGSPDKLRIIALRILAYKDRLPEELITDLQNTIR